MHVDLSKPLVERNAELVDLASDGREGEVDLRDPPGGGDGESVDLPDKNVWKKRQRERLRAYTRKKKRELSTPVVLAGSHPPSMHAVEKGGGGLEGSGVGGEEVVTCGEEEERERGSGEEEGDLLAMHEHESSSEDEEGGGAGVPPHLIPTTPEGSEAEEKDCENEMREGCAWGLAPGEKGRERVRERPPTVSVEYLENKFPALKEVDTLNITPSEHAWRPRRER